MKKKKIIIALSGGIDSTVSLIILKKKGFYIESIFMKNWEHVKKNCKNMENLTHVKNINKKMKIKNNIINSSQKYWEDIFKNILKSLKNGETPNPDIICNQKIKFKIFHENYIKIKNFNFLATGHYASIKKKNKFKISLSYDKNKDQTYFLYKIKKKITQKTIFPLSNYLKNEVKIHIKKYTIINFNKKESMGICFIGEENNKNFFKKFLNIKNGKIIETNTKKIITNHKGIFFYTLGEKIKGENLFIIKKDKKKNILFVSNKKNDLYKKKFILNNKIYLKKNIIYQAKTRSQGIISNCIIKNINNNIYIIFKNKQLLLTKGQHVVLYKNKICVNGFLIK